MNREDWGSPETCFRSSCGCPECAAHGPIEEMWGGIDEVLLIHWRSDGHGQCWYDPPGTTLRKPVRLRKGLGGGIVPVDRGKRRETIVGDLSPYLQMVSAEKRGPKGTTVTRVVTAVDSERANRGVGVSEAQARASERLGLSIDRVRTLYGKDDRPETYLAHRRWDREGPKSPTQSFSIDPADVARLVPRLCRRHGLSPEEAAARLGNERGWPVPIILRAFEQSQQIGH